MRNGLTISILLFTLLAPGWLTWGFLLHHKEQVRETVKARLLTGLPPAELVTWTFARAEAGTVVRWEHEREFEYRGQMYDVVEVAELGDSIRYRCYWDRAETRLNRELDRLAASLLSQDPAQRDARQRFAVFFESLFCEAAPSWSFSPQRYSHLFPAYYLATPGRPGLSPPTPPPKQS